MQVAVFSGVIQNIWAAILQQWGGAHPKKSQKNPIPIYRFWCSDWDFLRFFGFFWVFLGFFGVFLGFFGIFRVFFGFFGLKFQTP